VKLRWEKRAVTTPAEISAHNNMVETLRQWRHAGLVVEAEQGESLPELIDPPKRVVTCECGNDDLHSFTLWSLSDIGIYSLNRYTRSGEVEASYQEGDNMSGELAEELGLARKAAPGKKDDGTEYPRWDFKWLIRCDKCRKTEVIWSSRLNEFIDWN